MTLQETPLSPIQGKRVLIVDDDTMMVDILAQLLDSAGHTVTTAHDGQDALAKALEVKPDVVLLDIDLPGMNGYELARRLREDPDMGVISIAALTGHGRQADRHLAFEAGIDRYFCKPVGSPELIAFINQPRDASAAAAPRAALTPATRPAPPA